MQEPTCWSHHARADTRRDTSLPPRLGARHRRGLGFPDYSMLSSAVMLFHALRREHRYQQIDAGAEGLTPAHRPARPVADPDVDGDAGAEGDGARPGGGRGRRPHHRGGLRASSGRGTKRRRNNPLTHRFQEQVAKGLQQEESVPQEPHEAESSRTCLTEDVKEEPAPQNLLAEDTSSRNCLTGANIPHSVDDPVCRNAILASLGWMQPPHVPLYGHLLPAQQQPPRVPEFTHMSGLEYLSAALAQPSTSAASQPVLLPRPHVQPPSWNKENLGLPVLPGPTDSQLQYGGQAGAFPTAAMSPFRQLAQLRTETEAGAHARPLPGNREPQPVASRPGQGPTRTFATALHPNVTAGRPGLELTTKSASVSSASDVEQYFTMQPDRPVCGVCGKDDFHNRALYYAHMKVTQIKQKYRCDACGTHYGSASRLAHHCMGAGHKAKVQPAGPKEDERVFRCHFCQRGFLKSGMLHKHLRCKAHIMGLEQAGWLPIGTNAYLEGKGLAGRRARPGVLNVRSTWSNYMHLQELSKDMLAKKPEKQDQWSRLYGDFLSGDIPERFPYEADERLRDNMSENIVRPSFPGDFRPPNEA